MLLFLPARYSEGGKSNTFPKLPDNQQLRRLHYKISRYIHTLTRTSLRGRYSNLSSQTSDFTKSSLQDLKTYIHSLTLTSHFKHRSLQFLEVLFTLSHIHICLHKLHFTHLHKVFITRSEDIHTPFKPYKPAYHLQMTRGPSCMILAGSLFFMFFFRFHCY